MKEIVKTYAQGILSGVIASLLFALPLLLMLGDTAEDPFMQVERTEDLPYRDHTVLAETVAAAKPSVDVADLYLEVGEEESIDLLFGAEDGYGRQLKLTVDDIVGPTGTKVALQQREEALCFTPEEAGVYTVRLHTEDQTGRLFYLQKMLLANEKADLPEYGR